MFANFPIGRRIALSALFTFCAAILIVTLLGGLSNMYGVRLMQIAACVLAFIVVAAGIIAAVTGRLADYAYMPDEDEFELLVQRSERLAKENLAAEPEEMDFLELDPRNPRDFEELVREALDDLPDLLLKALDHVADRIIIFRDTLLRDFGDDPDELRAQVTRTVRHELAHHLGADELGVRELGL